MQFTSHAPDGVFAPRANDCAVALTSSDAEESASADLLTSVIICANCYSVIYQIRNMIAARQKYAEQITAHFNFSIARQVEYIFNFMREGHYAWFTGRWTNDVHLTSLLAANGQLTDLGKKYISLPEK